MAEEIGQRLALSVDNGEIRQINKVGHTRALSWQRMVTPPLFGGSVRAGLEYVIVDDHVGLGGTLANLRGYIEKSGGYVIAATTLTQSRNTAKIALTSQMQTM
jgi:hypothetical protein